VLACVASLFACSAQAQGIRPSYRPSSPTLSPWLQLYNRNTGPLDNYHSYVRPRQEVYRTFRQQESVIQRQGEGLRNLGQQVMSIRQEPIRSTGTGSTFMNYSHYYNFRGPGR